MNLTATIFLALLVLMTAGWTVFTRDGFSSVIGFFIYGMLLALVWMRLGAPDVALTEAAIGGGLTGVLLISPCAAIKRGAGVRANCWLPAVLCIAVTGGLAAVVLLLPEPAPSLGPAAGNHLAATGLENPVTAVLLAFRAWDTLLEKVVLLLALIGVWSVAPDALWGGFPRVRQNLAPAMKLLAQVLPPTGIVIGLFIFWNGSTDPGGAFQCGTILAAMWLLVMMAGLAEPPRISELWLRVVLVFGAVVFIAVGFGGFFFANAFLAYPESIAKPLILATEAALTLSIAATLGMMVAGSPKKGPVE